MKAYTDYPFDFLGDIPYQEAPNREIRVLSYDGNKYCKIMVEGWYTEIKSGYIYAKPGRVSEVPSINEKRLKKLRKFS
jgi:hypothetical protein